MNFVINYLETILYCRGSCTPVVCGSPAHSSLPGPGSRLLPSPDSAIHSTIYSPAASPCQSRHYSPFSSPYPGQGYSATSSYRTSPSPSLSRNNSDVSQYSLSPSQSPVTAARHPHHPSHPGFPSPALPSSPLHRPPPPYSHPVILPRHEVR